MMQKGRVMSRARCVIRHSKGVGVVKYTIDRFEGPFAVVELEDKSFINIPVKALPQEAKEGDVISVEINTGDTKARKQRIEKKMKDLWAD